MSEPGENRCDFQKDEVIDGVKKRRYCMLEYGHSDKHMLTVGLTITSVTPDPAVTLRSVLRQLRENHRAWTVVIHTPASGEGVYHICADALLPILREIEQALGEK